MFGPKDYYGRGGRRSRRGKKVLFSIEVPTPCCNGWKETLCDLEEAEDEGASDKIVYIVPPDDYVVKATRGDKIKAIFCIMTAFLGICVGWKTHLNIQYLEL